MLEETLRDGEQPRNAVKSTTGANTTQPVPVTSASDSETQAATGGSAASDPFGDLDALRLSQDFAAQAAVKPVYSSIPVRKPHKQEFVRTRSGNEWRFETGTFEDKETREIYMVCPSLWSELPGDVTPTCLTLTISRNSAVPFLWPLKLPGSDGRTCDWHTTAIAAAHKAESVWLKVVADMSAGMYVAHVATGCLPDPVWPEDLTMADLLRLAFRDRFVGSLDHPMLRRLRGEA
jgi:hypothetical protein